MKPTLNEKFLAYLALFSGLFLSLVAEYYSILGLTSIFSAAVIPVVIMGIALGLGKISATLWLKQNWSIAPWTMRGYLFTAIIVLMLVTSMGIFGFLSKAHSDQSLVSGDVQSKIAVYDEKIKIERENIDANRKALKQMDEAVDQVMGRSQDEKGADKAVSLRRAQQKERGRLLADITTAQQKITLLNEERAPIAAEVRKVEAEVGPIKYIAQFVYGETNEGLLEKAVTWVIIILIVVFDPLAVILLLSSQVSFQNFREREQEEQLGKWTDKDFEELTEEAFAEGDSPQGPVNVVDSQPTVTESKDPHTPGWMFENPVHEEKSILEQHPYLNKPFSHFKNLQPMVAPAYEPDDGPLTEQQIDQIKETVGVVETTATLSTIVEEPTETLFVQNEEQKESNLWSAATGIGPKEYFVTSQKKLDKPQNFEEYMAMLDAKAEREPLIAKYAALVKSGQMSIEKIPADYVDDVLLKLKA